MHRHHMIVYLFLRIGAVGIWDLDIFYVFPIASVLSKLILIYSVRLFIFKCKMILPKEIYSTGSHTRQQRNDLA